VASRCSARRTRGQSLQHICKDRTSKTVCPRSREQEPSSRSAPHPASRSGPEVIAKTMDDAADLWTRFGVYQAVQEVATTGARPKVKALLQTCADLRKTRNEPPRPNDSRVLLESGSVHETTRTCPLIIGAALLAVLSLDLLPVRPGRHVSSTSFSRCFFGIAVAIGWMGGTRWYVASLIAIGPVSFGGWEFEAPLRRERRIRWVNTLSYLLLIPVVVLLSLLERDSGHALLSSIPRPRSSTCSGSLWWEALCRCSERLVQQAPSCVLTSHVVRTRTSWGRTSCLPCSRSR
jgi:hypothetical protein